ncbi:MAG TPA: hypothetical protein VHO91_21595 [Rhodopila sp.]|nr:hypothetical protein [Rhodopila sp.]
MSLRRVALIAALAGLMALPAGAWAQGTDNVFLDAPGLLPKKPKAGPPEIKPQATVWPRLDPGAIFCHSEEDLRKVAARRSGQTVNGPIDCQIIQVATGISILHRDGPGLVEVQTTNPNAGGVGWTDAWLPNREPPGHHGPGTPIR